MCQLLYIGQTQLDSLVASHTTLCLGALDILVIHTEIHLNVRLACGDSRGREMNDRRTSRLASALWWLEHDPKPDSPRHRAGGADVVLVAGPDRHETG